MERLEWLENGDGARESGEVVLREVIVAAISLVGCCVVLCCGVLCSTDAYIIMWGARGRACQNGLYGCCF